LDLAHFLVSFFLFLDFLTLEDGTETLSRNVGKGLPFDAAFYFILKRRQLSQGLMKNKVQIQILLYIINFGHVYVKAEVST
jgi:hypothetical protein